MPLMLNHISICVDDAIWAGVLSDLGADISEHGVRFSPPEKKIPVAELSNLAARLGDERIRALGAESLSDSERALVLLLPRSAAELKRLLGYARESRTHTVETLIYNIRKKMGADFIRLDSTRGIYFTNDDCKL
jgi:hypothetical protein